MLSIPRIPLAVGLVLSAYAVYVEYRHSQELLHNANANSVEEEMEHFVALCDIEALNASCSKVFSLPQGRMLSYFGIVPKGAFMDWPNAALGLIYYTIMLALGPQYLPKIIVQFLVTMSFLSTVFLAYQLTFVVPELCLLCWSTHIINTYVMYRCFFCNTTTTGTDNASKKTKTT